MQKKIIDIFKHINLQSQAIFNDKKNSKKSLHILAGDASGVQVGDIEQAGKLGNEVTTYIAIPKLPQIEICTHLSSH